MVSGGGYIGELPGMIWGLLDRKTFKSPQNLPVSDAANSRYITAQPSHLATDTQKQVERRKKENEVCHFTLTFLIFYNFEAC